MKLVPTKVKNIARALAMSITGVERLPESVQTEGLTGLRPLRIGIIGLGVMGQTHADVLRGRPHFRVAGLASRSDQRRARANEFGCRWYGTADELIGSTDVEAVVIATPHWQHADLASAALQAGKHVICEKPLTVTVSQADAVIRAAERSGSLFTVVFQSRFEPAYQYAKALLDRGELGAVRRCEMVETFLRSQAYYKSSPWRGTWEGEGGGILVNQAPHVLDRYAWLCGMPTEVSAFCSTSLHAIDVEDVASAVFQHADGAQGFVHVSTNEAPDVARTVIACDRGRITIENAAVKVDRLDQSIRKWAEQAPEAFGNLSSRSQKFAATSMAWSPELLGRFYDQFALAASGKAPLAITGADGANAVELANGIMLSSAQRRSLKLPINRGEFEDFIASKSSIRKNDTQETKCTHP